jgi:hypothetical protein
VRIVGEGRPFRLGSTDLEVAGLIVLRSLEDALF